MSVLAFVSWNCECIFTTFDFISTALRLRIFLYEYVNTLLCVLYLTVYICISIRDYVYDPSPPSCGSGFMILPHRLVVC